MKRFERILIGGAMSSEVDPLVEALEDRITEERDGFTFHVGRIGDRQVIVSRTQIGKTNAAVSTYIGIKAYAPALVINQGTAGAHDIALDVGDIVVGEKLVNVDSFKTESVGEGGGYDILSRKPMSIDMRNGQIWEEDRYIFSDPELVEKALSTDYPKGKLVRGTIGTGDGFNRERDAILAIRKVMGTDCEEMETFAAAQVCRNMSVPFLAVRIISNSELKGKPFDEGTAARCCRFCVDLIRGL